MRKTDKLIIVILVIMVLILFVGCSKTNNKQNGIDDKDAAEVGTDIDEVDGEEAEENDKSDEIEEEPEVKEPVLSPSEQKAAQAIEILEAHGKKNLTYAPLIDSKDEYNLNIIKNIHMVAIETGEYSINQTKTNYGIGGTDLGISFNLGDKTFIAFGDTFLNEGMQGAWRSNVMAVATDDDYTDGIQFDYMVSVPGSKNAKELIKSRKVDNVEMTTIPTGGIAIEDTLYMSYMSVRHWGNPGEWDCNFGSIAKSVDGGDNWETLESLRWPGDSHFCQMAPVIIDDYVYILGITGGRRGPAKMMRVLVDEYENFDAYEFLMGYDKEGNPLYETGEKAMYDAYDVLPKAVGEMSVMYSDYLEEWLVTYMDGKADMVIRSAKNIYGPYSNPVIIAAQKDFPSLYGAFMNPKWVSEDGKKIGFMMSLFDPVYNVILMEMELER